MPARSISPRALGAGQGLPGGVLVLDAAGDIQECNPAARELLGEPLLGAAFAAVLGARRRSAPRAIAEHVSLRSGRFVNISRRELAAAARWCCSPTSPNRT
jgi:two-component system sensor histidine kinase FlrB